MQFEKIEKKDNKLILLVKNASVAEINAVRRAIIASLPSFAIDEVDVYENNSPIFNEYLANRLALVPLAFEEGVAEDAKIALSVNAEGPCTVHSGDLKSTDEKITPVFQNIPIIKLGEGQRFRAEATAIKGTAKEHAKFQSALASYSYYPEMSVGKNCNDCKKCVDACPRKIITKDHKLERADKCDLCAACEEACPKDSLKIKPKEGEYSFMVETYNNVSPEQQLLRAVQSMHAKAVELQKELK